MAQRFPIDYESLAKGDLIKSVRISQIIKEEVGSDRYQLKMLALKEEIERELHRSGKFWTLRTHNNDIRVLTDAEAAKFNHEEQERSRRMQVRRHGLQMAVDITQLTDDQKKEHTRNVEVDGKYMQAMLHVQKRLLASPHKRQTPSARGLPA